jgi:membrane dipeptidase
MFCLTANDVRRARAAGKLGLLIAVEGGHMINDSLATLRDYARLGARSMTLTHFINASWADSSESTPEHNGLTDFGKEVVREMNRLGMIVDVSHVSDKTFYDALEVSQAPMFASHSSTRAVASHARNMTDDMIKALAAKGGIIQINFHAGYLDEAFIQATRKLQPEVAALRKELEAKYPGQENAGKRAGELSAFRAARLPKVSWMRIVDHIDHAVKLVGADHVGLGSDFDGAPMPEGMEDASHYERITEELLRRGYSEADLKKILGGNTLRLLEEVEAVSKKLRGVPATN